MSLLVGPAITAYLWVKSLNQMMGLGSILGIVSSIGGMYISYYFDLPSGVAIVMLIFSFFSLSFLFSPTQGIINTPTNRQRLITLLKFKKKISSYTKKLSSFLGSETI